MMVLLPVEEARCCYQIVRCERVVLLLATSETSLYTNMPRDMIPAYSILQTKSNLETEFSWPDLLPIRSLLKIDHMI